MAFSYEDKFVTNHMPDLVRDAKDRLVQVKPKSNKTRHRQAAFIVALAQTFGIVSRACDLCGINRATYYEWYKSDTNFRNRVNSISDYQLDFVESKLLERISAGDTQAIIFYLGTKGKKRGYVKDDETVSANLNITINEYVAEAIQEVIPKEISE